ncbi:FG-GAP-like repeat-containing protein [Tautonia marina]|uniref:FG-GAP-like repeat-containing protein n=1 Tax=Tautonia marina TaxID=2653855 RepID=UPI001F16ECD4|nr:FG-GAP-like repeat-containing protein [Tautonia marina]
MRQMLPCSALVFLLMISATGSADEPFPRFDMQEIDPHAGNVVYSLTVADVNGDGKGDVCALTEDAIVWYENPTWERHDILKGATQTAAETRRDNVCFAPLDIDGDGDLDFALGADWRPTDTEGGGTLYWARQDSLEDWTLIPIGQEPTVHRMRWANVDGEGMPELIVLPLQGRGTSGPNWGEGNGVRILVYSIPDDPMNDSWPVEVASDALHTTHGFVGLDWDKDGRDELVVAAWEGVFRLDREGDEWSTKKLGTGNQESAPHKGASEVKVGRLADGRDYIATVEPWHGFQAAVYTKPECDGEFWHRIVIDEPLAWGHAVWTIDLDGDDDQELIIGHRDPNPEGAANPAAPGLYVYDPVPGSEPIQFDRHAIDVGGVAVEDAIAADLDGDGRPDLIAGGRATHNVRIYWNRPAEDAGDDR